jgi:hypothetical protein
VDRVVALGAVELVVVVRSIDRCQVRLLAVRAKLQSASLAVRFRPTRHASPSGTFSRTRTA